MEKQAGARRRDGAFWKLMDPEILETREVCDHVRVPRFWILGIFGIFSRLLARIDRVCK